MFNKNIKGHVQSLDSRKGIENRGGKKPRVESMQKWQQLGSKMKIFLLNQARQKTVSNVADSASEISPER